MRGGTYNTFSLTSTGLYVHACPGIYFMYGSLMTLTTIAALYLL